MWSSNNYILELYSCWFITNDKFSPKICNMSFEKGIVYLKYQLFLRSFNEDVSRSKLTKLLSWLKKSVFWQSSFNVGRVLFRNLKITYIDWIYGWSWNKSWNFIQTVTYERSFVKVNNKHTHVWVLFQLFANQLSSQTFQQTLKVQHGMWNEFLSNFIRTLSMFMRF